jgi:hypothetical protein
VFDSVFVFVVKNGFIADVLLQSTKINEVILVEFMVTQKCEEEKIRSGVRIIEYYLTDEEQIEPVKFHNLCDSDERIPL